MWVIEDFRKQMGMGGEKRSWSTGRGLRRVALLAVWYGGVWTACAAATGVAC